MGRPNTTTHQVLMLSAALSLVSNTCIAPQAYAISMPGASKKVSTFQLPAADKIDESDLQATDEAKKLPDLSPLSLPKDRGKKNNGDGAAEKSASTDGAGAEQSRGTADGEGGKDVLNGNITTSTFVPKGPLEGDNSALLAPTSVKGAKSGSTGVSKLGGNLMEQARSVNAAPLPLIKTDEEASKEADEQSELEREQLTGLWEAALTRSPEINFVIQKLMPSSDPSKVTSFMMRLLSSAVAAGACS